MGFVDLHLHTCRSDGACSPAEMVRRAAGAGITVLAIADHDVLTGSLEAAPLCEAAGLTLVPAVEMSTLFSPLRATVHVLAYRPDFSCPAFAAAVEHGRRTLNEMSDALIERLSREDGRVSLSDFRAFPELCPQGGWKALYYLTARGVCRRLTDALPLYARFGITYEAAGFFETEKVVSIIHQAGGLAVLAHPPSTFRAQGALEDPDALEDCVRQALACGFDGIECV